MDVCIYVCVFVVCVCVCGMCVFIFYYRIIHLLEWFPLEFDKFIAIIISLEISLLLNFLRNNP